jgi:hypothetical protein
MLLSQIPAKKSSVSTKFFPGLEFSPIFRDNRPQGQTFRRTEFIPFPRIEIRP